MKLYNYLAAGILLTIVAAGCSVSKDIEKPAGVIPSAYRRSDSSDTASIAAIPVKELFKDPALLVLIDSALSRNFDLLLAVKNIEASSLLLKQARLGNVPAVNLQVTANSNRPSNNSLNGLSASQFLGTNHIEDFNAGLNLSWEADIWGKIRSQKQAALAEYLRTTEVKRAVQTRLVADVAQGYYQLLMLDAQLEVARKSYVLNDSTLNMVRLQFAAGQVTSLAVQQAAAQQLLAAQLVPQLEQAIQIWENALRLLTGQLPGPVERSMNLARTDIPVAASPGLPAQLLSRRPDVRSAELALDVANARVGVAKANLYPSLNISATGGLNAFKASNWFNVPASLFGVVSGGLVQPVLQRGALRTQYKLAGIEREKTVLLFRQSVLDAVAEVSDELVKIEKLESQYDIVSKRVHTLQEAVSNANLLFRNGMATYLEVITAQNNALQSELELASVKTARLNAIVELYRSLGGGV